MLVHAAEEDVLLDFFVAAPGLGGVERRSELQPIAVRFEDAEQTFNVGAASCGVPGTPAGLAAATERFGSMPLRELTRPAIEHARAGVRVNAEQANFHAILEPILTAFGETAELYAPAGRILGEGDAFRFPDLAASLERLGDEGPDPFYRGEVAAALAAWVRERGGTLSEPDLAAYEPVLRDPVRAGFRGRGVLTNPPPSAGGILIALSLELLERIGSAALDDVIAVMEVAQAERTEAFQEGLYEEGFARRLLAPDRLARAAGAIERGERPGSPDPGPEVSLGETTHITAVDGRGGCAAVTCSNGTGSGMLVPDTGVHLNNMLGEQDLNPHGFYRVAPGRRLPSMMAPTVVLRDGQLEAGLGSGGSNRIRSAVLETIVRLVVEGMGAQAAVEAPRAHFEADAVQVEPGIAEAPLRRLERRGYEVVRWRSRSVFYGGAHTVTRNPATGELEGGGDPRRGGAVAYA